MHTQYLQHGYMEDHLVSSLSRSIIIDDTYQISTARNYPDGYMGRHIYLYNSDSVKLAILVWELH